MRWIAKHFDMPLHEQPVPLFKLGLGVGLGWFTARLLFELICAAGYWVSQLIQVVASWWYLAAFAVMQNHLCGTERLFDGL